MEDIKSIAYWEKVLEPYKKSNLSRSFMQLFLTIIIFLAVCYVMYVTSDKYYAITLLLSLFAGGLVVKFFIIQHDCGHGSFFKSDRGK